MKQSIVALILILLIQCGIAAVVYWPRVDEGPTQQGPALSDIDPQTVDEIHIGDEYDNEAVLINANGRWTLPEMGNLPADPEKIATLLSSLTGSSHGWPVAQTAAARQRFQVADYHYQRRIILIGGGELLGTVYLGTSPGFRRVHVRSDGREEVYSIEFNSFDAPGENGPWMDRSLLQVRVPVSISGDLYDLRRDGESWISGWGEQPDQRELAALLDGLRHLQAESIANEDMQRELATSTPELTLHVNSLSGEQTLELFKLRGRHYIHSSKYKLFFGISGYDYDRLTGIDAERLMGPGPAAANAGDDETDP